MAAAPSFADYFSYLDYPTSSFGGHVGSTTGGGAAARSRWSWPWTDASAAGFNLGAGALDSSSQAAGPIAAATFKKHHHHHHSHAKPEHHHAHHLAMNHHDFGEHHHLSPKWEHGISLGEIACIAVAVVLGIVILGSPFFLLFLMLFNGGNLLGATQMGILAPAAVQGAATAAAGRRRRRRRRSLASSGAPHSSSPQTATNKHASAAAEYLFERLSPFIDADVLMRSFERLMDVKDDIERIVAQINEGDAPKFSLKQDSASQQRQRRHEARVEMRRR